MNAPDNITTIFRKKTDSDGPDARASEGVDQVINVSDMQIAPLISYLSVQHVIIIEKYFSTSTLGEKEARLNQRFPVLPTV